MANSNTQTSLTLPITNDDDHFYRYSDDHSFLNSQNANYSFFNTSINESQCEVFYRNSQPINSAPSLIGLLNKSKSLSDTNLYFDFGISHKSPYTQANNAQIQSKQTQHNQIMTVKSEMRDRNIKDPIIFLNQASSNTTTSETGTNTNEEKATNMQTQLSQNLSKSNQLESSDVIISYFSSIVILNKLFVVFFCLKCLLIQIQI
jgi:hypothetical protein